MYNMCVLVVNVWAYNYVIHIVTTLNMYCADYVVSNSIQFNTRQMKQVKFNISNFKELLSSTDF